MEFVNLGPESIAGSGDVTAVSGKPWPVPKDIGALREQAPGASERAYVSTAEELVNTYGRTAYGNYVKQLRSERRVEQTRSEIVKAKENAESNPETPTDPFWQEYIDLRNLSKKLVTERTTEEGERSFLNVIRERYEKGHITLADKRTAILTKNRAQSTTRRIVRSSLEGMAESGFSPDKKAKKAVSATVESVIRSRLCDILLSFDSEEDMDEKLASTVQTVTSLVGDLAFDPWVDNLPSTKPGSKDGESDEVTPPSQLEQLAHEYLNASIYPGYRLEFNLGIGGSEDAPTVRFPAAAVPALRHLKTFVESGLPNTPIFRIFDASELSTDTNELDRDAAKRNATLSEDLMREFIGEFYPDCLPYVRFEKVPLETVKGSHYETDAASLESDETPSDHALRKALSDLVTRGQEHNSAHTDRATLLYAAAHPALFRNYFPVDQAGPDAVVKFGGRGENNFNTVQESISQRKFRDGANTNVYLTNTAGHNRGPRPIFASLDWNRKPGYYRTGNHELSITDPVLEKPITWQKLYDIYEGDWYAGGDLEVLERHSVGYPEFLARASRRLREAEASW